MTLSTHFSTLACKWLPLTTFFWAGRRFFFSGSENVPCSRLLGIRGSGVAFRMIWDPVFVCPWSFLDLSLGCIRCRVTVALSPSMVYGLWGVVLVVVDGGVLACGAVCDSSSVFVGFR